MDEQPEGVRVRMFIGADREAAFWQEAQRIGEATLSPGGVAARLGVSRQRVWILLQTGELRAWMYKKHEKARVAYCLIPISDVDKYAQRVGRSILGSSVDIGQRSVLE